MPPRTQRDLQEKRERKRTKTMVEGERGWAGQHGQRPANKEEKNYRGAEPASGTSTHE
ncbi:MAG TPA: hypothetical protein VF988_15905 [Verrucomicrobiae bacterium]